MTQTSRAKLPAFFSRFQTEEFVLTVNKSKITGENTFTGNYFGIEGNHGLGKDEKKLFRVFLQIYHHCFNTDVPKHVLLCFSGIDLFFQFFTHLLEVLEARIKLIFLYTK